MKQFNEDFKTKLFHQIEEIEGNSVVEIVAIIRRQSEKYHDVAMLWAVMASFAVFSCLMFINAEINPYVIYFATVIIYPIVYLLVGLVPFLMRLLINKKRKLKSVEIMSRALFQKGGIRFTKQKIGVLFFVSELEQIVRIEADRGVLEVIPADIFEKMQNDFQTIFKAANTADAFIEQLKATKDIFTKFLPPVENDINELPDNLQIDL